MLAPILFIQVAAATILLIILENISVFSTATLSIHTSQIITILTLLYDTNAIMLLVILSFNSI